MLADAPLVPRYGDRSLSDLLPSLLGVLGVAGEVDRLDFGEAALAAVLVVDGLGWELLRSHPEEAPFLTAAAREPLTSGFPSTTAASLSSIGTGLPPGEHGLVGYTIAVPGEERPMNVLIWQLYGHGGHVDLRGSLPPERFQPRRTAFQRATSAGVAVTLIGPRHHAHSGLTRASLRGGHYRPALGMGDVAAEVVASLREASGRSLVYAYHPDLDLIGHVRGGNSEAWRLHLRHVDRLASDIAERLPAGALLVITGDHGMVDIDVNDRIDVDDDPGYLRGVRLLAGEPRARHVHAQPGAEAEVLAAWEELAGGVAWVRSRETAIDAGWFGPAVPDRVRPAIGDVVVASRGRTVITNRAVDPLQAQLRGHHGSLTAGEVLVPLVVVRGDAEER